MRLVTGFMKEAGMEVRVDPLGNVFGHFAGADSSLPTVLTGSHLDSVPNGGKLDGALGLISAIECVNAWHDAGWKPRCPTEVVALVEEEGTQFGLALFGSRVLVGKFKANDPVKFINGEGKSLAAMLAECGLEQNAFQTACLDPARIRCFIELHIEQGDVLDSRKIPCGLVTDIVGIYRCWVTVTGQANHAGTTRMARRKDALVAASHLVKKVFEGALHSQNRFVATVGSISVSPGAINIVPGEVTLPIEIRAPKLADFEPGKELVSTTLREVEREYGVATEITKTFFLEPAHMDDRLVAVLRRAAEEKKTEYLEIPSWAGHDSQMMATIVPTAMLFVPSVGGISHAPQEDTRWEDIALGLQVYLRALTELASN
jgi:allantoate deiminase/N-carbamoyl-L-amino-acid hydrolase